MTEAATDTTSAATADTKTADTTATNTDKTILETPISVLNPDGTFVDGWQEKGLPEDLRGETSLKVIKSLPDLVKRTVNAEKMVGKNKVVVPTEKSTPAEWDAYYAAGGRPKTPADYKVEIPADMKSLYSDDRLAEFRKVIHAHGGSQKMVDALLQLDLAASSKILQDQQAEELREKQETELALKKEWGAAYEERIHVAKRLVAEALPQEEQRLDFLAKYGDDPAFIRFAATVGSRMAEHKALVAELTTRTPAEALKKAEQLRATPGYTNPGSSMTPQERESITAQIREQMKLAYPETNARKTA